VPLLSMSTDLGRNAVKAWLHPEIPERAPFKVAYAGKYLGAFLGPIGGKLRWCSAVDKWVSRTLLIASANAPTSVTAFMYNSRVVNALSYLA
jgi:hypothetical protein